MAPRGRYEVSPSEAKAWFDEVTDGASFAQIARESGRDPRTVKRAVQFYAASLETKEVRRDSLRAALETHYTVLLDLLKAAGERAASDHVPSFNRLPMGSSRPSLLSPFGFRIEWRNEYSAIARYQEEGTPSWTMLQSHVGRDPIWVRFRNWRDAGSELGGEMLLTFISLVSTLTEATGADLARKEGPGIVVAGIRHLFDRVAAEAAGSRTAITRALASLTADERGVWVEGSWMLVQGPGLGSSKVSEIRSAVDAPKFRELVKRLGASISKCRETGRSFAEDIAFVAAVPHLGGECRACARLSL